MIKFLQYSIEKIETQRGKIIYRAKRTKITKVLDEETVAIMTAMLKKVITSGTGRGADINKPMGGKTGTTNDNKDAWFIGFTPDIVTGVFMGNDDNSSIGLTGGSAPARIWKGMMQVATERYGKHDFDYPEIDFTINFTEGSYENNEEGEEAEAEGNSEQNNSNPVIPLPVKNNEDFGKIPVQLNENIVKVRNNSLKEQKNEEKTTEE